MGGLVLADEERLAETNRLVTIVAKVWGDAVINKILRV